MGQATREGRSDVLRWWQSPESADRITPTRTSQASHPATSSAVSRRAKIVCTLGPATAGAEKVRRLVECGMDVARLNFSHGTHADHQQMYSYVRAASESTSKAVGVLADLQGPKIRLGNFGNGVELWATGEEVRITVADVLGTHDRVSTTYGQLAADAKAGDRLLVDDGNIELQVTAVDGQDVVCRVIEGGKVSNHKGLSLPGMNVSVPAMSGKDIADLEFALDLGVDFIALSFVRSPADIDLVHAVMDRKGVARLPVVAKLEKPEAVDNLEAIVLAFDGVMVARGDPGVELPLEHVPLVQKRAIQIARENAKPVIVATQMLESMITNSRRTGSTSARQLTWFPVGPMCCGRSGSRGTSFDASPCATRPGSGASSSRSASPQASASTAPGAG